MTSLGNRCGWVLAIAAAYIAPAQADDTLVMPYSCSVASGRPALYSSDQRGHRVVGHREQRSFTACSPVNPNQCRTWMLHRFVMDCAGVEVPWMTVAAASQATRGRGPFASIENGRMLLHMPPAWSIAADDPCARGPTYDPRWNNGQLSRYCADRRALTPPAVVEFPPGFAPMFGFDGIFVGDSHPASSRPLAANEGRPGRDLDTLPGSYKDGPSQSPPGWIASPRPTAGVAPPVPSPSNSAVALPKRRPLDPPTDAGAEPDGEVARNGLPASRPAPQAGTARPAPGVVTPPPAAAGVVVTPPPAAAAAGVEPSPLAVTAPTRPALINSPQNAPAVSSPPEAPKAAVTAPPPSTNESASPAPASPSTSTSTVVAARDTTTNTARTDAIGAIAADRMDATRPVKLYASKGISFTTYALIAAGLTTLGLAWLLWGRRKTEPATAAVAPRDFGSFHLDAGGPPSAPFNADGPPSPFLPTGGTALAVTPPVRAAGPLPEPPAAQPSQTAAARQIFLPSAWTDEVPRTRDEALQILGMGVGADASATAIKKIVDGLRLSWHPDQAAHGEDRTLRELRIRQINAAWDIIADKRPPTDAQPGA